MSAMLDKSRNKLEREHISISIYINFIRYSIRVVCTKKSQFGPRLKERERDRENGREKERKEKER